MNTAADQSSGIQVKEKSSVEVLTTDTLVYLSLALLVWGTWRISQLGLFTPGDDTGYWLGVAGSVMMLVVLCYPLRKYLRFAAGWGNIRPWFWMHIVLGVLGPLFILLHSNFKTGSLNAAVAFYCMILVTLSGVAGRFIFRRVNRGLYGEQTSFQELSAKAGMDQDDAQSRLSFAPEVDQKLKEFAAQELVPHQGIFYLVRAVVWLPLRRQWVRRQCVVQLEKRLSRMAANQSWSQADLKRRRKAAKKLVDRYLESVARVAQYSAYSFLFSLWHVAHVPFVYVLVLTALVHVYAVHVY